MTSWHAVGSPIPRARLLNPLGPYLGLIAHLRLVYDLVRRDVAGRYRGAMGGKLWAFLTPLLMLAVYSFVFGYIFQARWTAVETQNVSFPIVLFVGLIFANFFTECLNRAPGLVISNANYVKKVVFPLEVLSWVAIGTSLFHACLGVSVLMLAMWATGTLIPATALLLPLVFILFIPMVAGFIWFLAAMGVYFRDLLQFVAVLSTALVFLAPIFYPRTMLPEEYRWLLMLNPLSFIVETAHGLLLWGRWPDWTEVLAYLGVALTVAWLGWLSFQLTRKGFADVI